MLATAAGAVLLVTVLIGSGLVRVEFLPQVEGDVIAANFELPTGSPADRTAATGVLVEETGRRVAERLASEHPGSAAADDWNSAITVGEPAELFNPLRGDRASVPRGHVGAVQFALPEGAAVGQAIESVRLQHPTLEPYLDNLRFSLHMDFVEADTALRDGDEVVLIPPVSGGYGCSASPQNP